MQPGAAMAFTIGRFHTNAGGSTRMTIVPGEMSLSLDVRAYDVRAPGRNWNKPVL